MGLGLENDREKEDQDESKPQPTEGSSRYCLGRGPGEGGTAAGPIIRGAPRV